MLMNENVTMTLTWNYRVTYLRHSFILEIITYILVEYQQTKAGHFVDCYLCAPHTQKL